MKNKTILITGGTTGIGLATAQLLSAEGAKIIITGQNPDTLATAKKQLPAETVVLRSDSSSLTDAQALGDELKKHVNRLDGAFLNAGVGQFIGIENQTPEGYDRMFNVNVRGPYFQLKSILPLLANPSSVVLTSSIAGSIAVPHSSVYSATKAAIISLGKTLSVELASKGIRVNVVSPGPIETPIIGKLGLSAEATRKFEEATVQKSLAKRWGKADEVARLVRYLLAPESSFVVGSEFIIDGGVRLT